VLSIDGLQPEKGHETLYVGMALPKCFLQLGPDPVQGHRWVSGIIGLWQRYRLGHRAFQR